jgi:hypothetical protein
MRTLTFDQFEFDPPDAEEGLEISIATRRDRPFPDLATFASAVWGAEKAGNLPRPIPFEERIGPGNVRVYLQRYAALMLPDPCEWPTYVVSNEWNDWDAVLVGPETLIRYHWWTTA